MLFENANAFAMTKKPVFAREPKASSSAATQFSFPGACSPGSPSGRPGVLRPDCQAYRLAVVGRCPARLHAIRRARPGEGATARHRDCWWHSVCIRHFHAANARVAYFYSDTVTSRILPNSLKTNDGCTSYCVINGPSACTLKQAIPGYRENKGLVENRLGRRLAL